MAGLDLPPRERAWLDAYRQALAQQFGTLVKDVIVFGSKARGEATKDSDLDLLIVVEDGDWRLKWNIADVAYSMAIGTDVVPSVQVYTVSEWEMLRRRRSIFRDAVERDGVPIG